MFSDWIQPSHLIDVLSLVPTVKSINIPSDFLLPECYSFLITLLSFHGLSCSDVWKWVKEPHLIGVWAPWMCSHRSSLATVCGLQQEEAYLALLNRKKLTLLPSQEEGRFSPCSAITQPMRTATTLDSHFFSIGFSVQTVSPASFFSL